MPAEARGHEAGRGPGVALPRGPRPGRAGRRPADRRDALRLAVDAPGPGGLRPRRRAVPRAAAGRAGAVRRVHGHRRRRPPQRRRPGAGRDHRTGPGAGEGRARSRRAAATRSTSRTPMATSWSTRRRTSSRARWPATRRTSSTWAPERPGSSPRSGARSTGTRRSARSGRGPSARCTGTRSGARCPSR